MSKSAEILVGIVIIGLIIVGTLAYVIGVPTAVAPTKTSTTFTAPNSSQTQGATSTAPIGLTTYTDPSGLYHFMYPSSFNLSGGDGSYSQDWMLNSTENGMLLIKVTVPQSFQPNTNFGDAKLTVGTSSHPGAVSSCLTAPTSGMPTQKSSATINGTQYTKYSYSDAAAGNRYDTTSYRTIHDGQCYAIEYTIHYGTIQNYPTGSVQEFNETKVQQTLEGIVQSFAFKS